jgi:hypothetical protein
MIYRRAHHSEKLERYRLPAFADITILRCANARAHFFAPASRTVLSRYVGKKSNHRRGGSIFVEAKLPTNPVVKLFSNKNQLVLLSEQIGPAIAELLNILSTEEKQI